MPDQSPHRMGPIRSYSDYGIWRDRLLARLDDRQSFSFSVWCLQRALDSCREDLSAEFSRDTLQAIRGMIRELTVAADSGTILPTDRATTLLRSLQSLGRLDEVAAIEVHPLATEALAALEDPLEYCRSRDQDLVARVSESPVIVLDYRLSDAYDHSSMFTHPRLRAELEAQERRVSEIQGESW